MQVYFRKDTTFDPKLASFPYDYIHVADVEDKRGIEQVFELCNNIDHPWIDNDPVTYLVMEEVEPCMTPDRCRSMSIGDLVQIGETLHLCVVCGWEEITLTEYWVTGPFGELQVKGYNEANAISGYIETFVEGTEEIDAIPNAKCQPEECEAHLT